MKHFDDSVSLARGFVRLHEQRHHESRWWNGDYIGPEGMVSIYMQDDLTRLDYGHNGRLHMRTFEGRFTQRGLPRVCRKFIAEVREGLAA